MATRRLLQPFAGLQSALVAHRLTVEPSEAHPPKIEPLVRFNNGRKMHSFLNVRIVNKFLLAFYQRGFIAVIFDPNI